MIRAPAQRAVRGGLLAMILVAGAVMGAWPTPVQALVVFTVNSTGDASDLVITDAFCDTSAASGRQCTLRAAIQEANDTPGADRIIFNIPGGAGLNSIVPASALPPLTEAVTVDGYSQPGASPNTVAQGNDAVLKIQLNGINAGGVANGIEIQADGCVILGLVINRFGGSGIEIEGSNNRVEGNLIGTGASGTGALGNNDGVSISDGTDNAIGAATRAARNLISGNEIHGVDISGSADNTTVQGNYIGTNKAGTASLGNLSRGVSISGSATATIVGGTVSAARNIISGNGGGIAIVSANGNLVQGNFIGTNAAGGTAMGNGSDGVLIQSNNNTIGGTAAGARNVISGNGDDGVQISALSTGNTIQGNRIGTTSGGAATLGNALAGVFVSSADGNTIGGTAAGAGNVISGNGTEGIFVSGGDANVIRGNRVGTKADGSGDLGNFGDGVFITSSVGGSPSNDNIIGGAGGGANVISGNGSNGVLLTGLGGGTQVQGNVIRINDGRGVLISSDGNTVGGGNVILGNANDGVEIAETGVGNRIISNQIFGNTGLGIDLVGGTEDAAGVTSNDNDDPDVGSNNLQNFPVIAAATRSNATGGTTVIGTLNSNPSQEFTIQLFLAVADSSNHGEGQVQLGAQTVQTNAAGDTGFNFAITGLSPGQVLTATATNTATGNTSEFALNRPVVPGP